MAKLLIFSDFYFALLALGINSGLMSHLTEKMNPPLCALLKLKTK